MAFIKIIKRDSVLTYLSYAILLLGVALRLALYFQNRNIFVDEANIARNIYERDFLQLLQPLDYKQYAPPFFLWAVKVVCSICGYSEYALKIVSLLSGFGVLILTYLILKAYGVRKVIWYPLFLISTGIIYIRYATELKQYSLDCLIALGLIYLAVRIDGIRIKPVTFLAIWGLAGSVAIWSSMPAVFTLAGVGVYYFAVFYARREFRKIYPLIGCGLIWLVQFGVYYQYILKPQVQDDYLQNFHKSDFLFLLPKSVEELAHNWEVMMNVLGGAGGHWGLSLGFHLTMIVMALVCGVGQRRWTVLLLVVPMILVLVAAALHQFSLMPRVVMFIMPLLLILAAIGFEEAFRWPYGRVPLLVISAICLFNFSQLQYFYEPYQTQQITDSLTFLEEQKIQGSQLYVNFTAEPAYIYYTTMHPARAKWQVIKDAHLAGMADFDSLAQTMKGRTSLIYSFDEQGTIDYQQARINKYLKTTAHFVAVRSQVFIYEAKD